MTASPINAARQIGAQSEARRVVIIALDGEGFAITTWGKTKAECQALGRWAESAEADALVASLAD